jgi:hypothetical protein
LIINLSQELVALGIKLSIDVEDRLFAFFLVEYNWTVTGSNDLFLILDFSNESIN